MLSISNTTKHALSLSNSLLEKISQDILGEQYSLSIVIVGDKKARSLNQEYRGKDYIPNVLSFPIDESMGEIFMNPKASQLEAHKFNLNTMQYFYYLLIHSMLHLKGYDHSDDMSLEEKKYMKKFFDIEIDF
jgi:probable rRNA maturation factor